MLPGGQVGRAAIARRRDRSTRVPSGEKDLRYTPHIFKRHGIQCKRDVGVIPGLAHDLKCGARASDFGHP